MATQIFSSFKEFCDREDKMVNGVSPDFASAIPDWEENNASNKGCWECYNCVDCVFCTDCTGCTCCVGRVDYINVSYSHAQDDEKMHWYLFVFQYSDQQGQTIKNHFTGMPVNEVTLAAINDTKQNAEVPQNSVCLGFYYCGLFTQQEMLNKSGVINVKPSAY